MKYSCAGRCNSLSFPIELLYNKSIATYYRTDTGKWYSIKKTGQDGMPQKTKRYTTKTKALGLAKCKICQYITAKPTKPGKRCPCCRHQLSQSIRDIKAKNKAEIYKRNE